MIHKVKFRAPHAYDVDQASDEATIKDNGESLTIQSHSEDADINVLMRRFGVIPPQAMEVRTPMYGDFTGIRDFRTAVTVVAEAQDAFLRLPSAIRHTYENDPQLFLQAIETGEAVSVLKAHGLILSPSGASGAPNGTPPATPGSPAAPAAPSAS